MEAFLRKIHGNANDRISSKEIKKLNDERCIEEEVFEGREEQWSRFENILHFRVRQVLVKSKICKRFGKKNKY